MYQFMNKSSGIQAPSQLSVVKKQFQNDEINKTGIPVQMKQHYERISGCCLDDVRVHYQSDKPVQLKALAYAQGNQIFMAPGQEKHLGHELAHVIQQKQGRVSPTEYHAGIPINADRQLEQEADNMHNLGCLHSPLRQSTDAGGVAQLLEEGDVNVENPSETIEILSQELDRILKGYEYSGLLCTVENMLQLKKILYPNINYASLEDREEFFGSELKGIFKRMESPEKNFTEYMNKVLERIEEGVEFLCGSIDYWIEEIYNKRVDFLQSNKKPEVIEIRLTGSDLHDEGLGAAFVTFRLFKSFCWIPYKTDKTVLIKPENRDIEESLLSDKDTSLANQYNQSEWEIEKRRDGEVVELNPEEGQINTIRMKASKVYGTIIEQIVGEKIKEGTESSQVNLISTLKSIVFAAMCGLYDLHRENVLWSEDGELYFIDADNALKSDALNHTEQTQKQSGFPIDFRKEETLIKLLYVSPDIIEMTKKAFEGKHGRVVPLLTNYLSNIKRRLWIFPEAVRMDFLQNQYAVNLLCGGAVNETGVPKRELHSMEGPVRERGPGHKEDLITEFLSGAGPGLIKEAGADPNTFNGDLEVNLAYDDFMSGQIPFFEYWYTEGEIRHRGTKICETKKLDEVFKEAFPKKKKKSE